MLNGFSCSLSLPDIIVAHLDVLGAISFEWLFTCCLKDCSFVHLIIMYFGTKISGQ